MHLSRSLSLHGASKTHLKAATALHAFAAWSSIQLVLDEQISEESKKWYEVLTVQFGLNQVLGLPFRGHSGNINDTNCGMYLSLLNP